MGISPRSVTRRLSERRWPARVALLGVVAVAVAHGLAVGSRYHIGSFDDDASYILMARALAHGAGLTSHLSAGYPLVGAYPPGYPVLLAPLVVLFPGATLPMRALSFVLFVALFPLTWSFLRRRGVEVGLRVAAVTLLALNPVLATYSTMVMAEVPFLVLLLVLVWVADRWERCPAVFAWPAVATVVTGAGLLWIKEAGVGLIVGLAAWFVLRGRWPKALLLAVGTTALMVPLLVARAVARTPLIGSRYSSDLGSALAGGFAARLSQIVPHLGSYVSSAIPQSVLPTGIEPLPTSGPLAAVLSVAGEAVVPLAFIGAVVWWRRHHDPTVPMVVVYLAETLVYPFINERRVVLILPLVVAWAVVGAVVTVRAATVLVSRFGRSASAARLRVVIPTLVAVMALGVVVVPLGAQFSRDYLFSGGQSSSHPGGSTYMALLHDLGPPTSVVETDYVWTTALDTGHRTANTAYTLYCDDVALRDSIDHDDAGFLLSAGLNAAGVEVDNDCLLGLVTTEPWAVRLYRTDRDDASVFELIGHGTGHPDLVDLTAGARPDPAITGQPETAQSPSDHAGAFSTTTATNGRASFTWTWAHPAPVTQVSLGAAGAMGGATNSVTVQLRRPDGTWHTVGHSAGAVGAGEAHPYLLSRPTRPVSATAVRVVVATSAAAAVHDLHVLGRTP
jgi:hypothetical protein